MGEHNMVYTECHIVENNPTFEEADRQHMDRSYKGRDKGGDNSPLYSCLV